MNATTDRSDFASFRLLVAVGRLLLAVVFFYAGAVKMSGLRDFHQDILNFQWIHDPLAAWPAISLPFFEILCAMALLIPSWARAAAVLLAGLLVGFLCALGRAWFLGLDLHCGCFGPGGTVINYPLKLLQNFILLLAAAAVLFSPNEWSKGN